MSKVLSIGRFLDQPILISKFEKTVPYILGTGAVAYTAKEVIDAPKKKGKVGLKNAIILGATIFSALKAPKVADKIVKRAVNGVNISKFQLVKKENAKVVEDIISANKKLSKGTKNILQKSARGEVLNLEEVHTLRDALDIKSFNKLIPEPVSVTSKDIFKEIGWLSVFGAVPVVGGIIGGIVADMLTEKHWENRISNKIKEGVYQYLANIFMCNVGAGAALFGLEKAGITSKSARCVGMVAGIILTGVIGGSYIANFISNKILNPLLCKNPHKEYRRPEVLDLGLHTDDIATVAVLSGLKWIEPALPILYSISGYRAGIGYRNDNKSKDNFLCAKC